MATYYVELDGGNITPKTTLKGGDVVPSVQFSGAQIYPTSGSGGGANLQAKDVTYTSSNVTQTDTVEPDAGYDGLSEVNIEIGAMPNASPLILSGLAVQNDGTVEVDLDIVNGGYIPSQSDTLEAGTLSVQPAQTITPTTTDQTIASGKFLTGTQTILGDPNLVPANIAKGVTIFGVTGTAETGGVWVEETITTSGAVTQALDPYTLYHFTGALTSLTITLNAAASGEIAHYHFDFLSGSTAPTLSVPSTVTMPDSFAVEASKRYEVDVLNNYGSVIAWTE